MLLRTANRLVKVTLNCQVQQPYSLHAEKCPSLYRYFNASAQTHAMNPGHVVYNSAPVRNIGLNGTQKSSNVQNLTNTVVTVTATNVSEFRTSAMLEFQDI